MKFHKKYSKNKYWNNFLTHCISHILLFLRRRTQYTTRYEKYRDFFVPIRWQRKFFILEKRRVYDPERKAESPTVCMKVARCLETATKQEYDLHRGSLLGSLIDTKLEYGAQTERLPTQRRARDQNIESVSLERRAFRIESCGNAIVLRDSRDQSNSSRKTYVKPESSVKMGSPLTRLESTYLKPCLFFMEFIRRLFSPVS